jgi:hypothetical protein
MQDREGGGKRNDDLFSLLALRLLTIYMKIDRNPQRKLRNATSGTSLHQVPCFDWTGHSNQGVQSSGTQYRKGAKNADERKVG